MEITFHEVHTCVCDCCAAERIAEAASTSKRSEVKDADALVRKLLYWGHETPLEFVNLYFQITTSRAIANELVRHRMASFVQESTRYVAQDNLTVVAPSWVGSKCWGDHTYDVFVDAMKKAEESYRLMRESAYVSRDMARDVLPLATATNLAVQMNLRSFRHFLGLRLDPAAHLDMRLLAALMHEAACNVVPEYTIYLKEMPDDVGDFISAYERTKEYVKKRREQ